MKESDAMTGLPVVKLNPLSKQYTTHQTALRRSLKRVSFILAGGGSR